MRSKKDDYQEVNLVVRLERNQNEVGELRQTLNSYIYEPKTHRLYERMESLKTGLEHLSKRNSEIILALKSRKKSVGEYVENVKQQLTVFHELQTGVNEYIHGARSN